jgi:hypothetical protein
MNKDKCGNAGLFRSKAPVYHYTQATFLIFLIFFSQFVSSISLFFPGYLPSDDWLKSSHVLLGGGLKVTMNKEYFDWMSVDHVDQAQSKNQVVDQDWLTTSVANSVHIDCVYSIQD